MTKVKEEKAVKNYGDYVLTEDVEITISAQEYVAMQTGLDKAIVNGVRVERPQIIKAYNLKTGKVVEKPTAEQLKSGKVKRQMDTEATFSNENKIVFYPENLDEVIKARQVMMMIYERLVDEDKLITRDEAKKRYEQRESKGQLKVQDDEPVAAPRQNPEATMNVVKDEPKTEDKQ